MGGTLSKASKNVRILEKAAPKKPGVGASVNSTRPAAPRRNAEETLSGNTDADVVKRMQQLGPVQYKKIEENYVPASEEAFTITLEARKQRETQGAAELEKGGPRTLLHSTTITAILQSLKEGDSPESVARTYKVDPTVLPRLSKLSLPDGPRTDAPNQLLDAHAPRQPVRRRRKEAGGA